MTDSAKSFWTMIFITILAGIAWLSGCRKLFKWWDTKMTDIYGLISLLIFVGVLYLIVKEK